MTKRKAVDVAKPSVVLPSVEIGGGRRPLGIHQEAAPADLIPLIIDKCRERRHHVSMQNKLNNGLGAYVRMLLGWRGDLPEVERKRIARKAKELIAKTVKGKGGDAIVAVVMANLQGCAPADARRKALEDELCRLAAMLPAAPWWKALHGLDLLGLALIVGEAGDLSNYANPGKLWKRMGVAPFSKDGATRSGIAWRVKGGLSKDDWTQFGYSPKRCSVVYQITLSFWMAQGKGETATEWRKVYDDYKLHLQTRAEPHKYPHGAALRYLGKRLLRELWKAWRAARDGVVPFVHVPPAPPDPEQPGANACMEPAGQLPSAALEAAD